MCMGPIYRKNLDTTLIVWSKVHVKVACTHGEVISNGIFTYSNTCIFIFINLLRSIMKLASWMSYHLDRLFVLI